MEEDTGLQVWDPFAHTCLYMCAHALMSMCAPHIQSHPPYTHMPKKKTSKNQKTQKEEKVWRGIWNFTAKPCSFGLEWGESGIFVYSKFLGIFSDKAKQGSDLLRKRVPRLFSTWTGDGAVFAHVCLPGRVLTFSTKESTLHFKHPSAKYRVCSLFSTLETSPLLKLQTPRHEFPWISLNELNTITFGKWLTAIPGGAVGVKLPRERLREPIIVWEFRRE